MSTVTLAELPARLPQLIDQLRPGEEVVVTRDDQPVARITAEPPAPQPRMPRKAGNCRGMAVIVVDDDAHLVVPLDLEGSYEQACRDLWIA